MSDITYTLTFQQRAEIEFHLQNAQEQLQGVRSKR
jgi:hypothetical protein